MMILCTNLLVLLLVGCVRISSNHSPGLSANGSNVVQIALNDPELVPDQETEVALRYTNAEQLALADRSLVRTAYYTPVTTVPALEPNDIAGRDFPIGYRRVAWLLQGQALTGFELRVDVDEDGDLAEESPLKLRYDGNSFVVYVKVPARPDYSAVVARVAFAGDLVTVNTANSRSGYLRHPKLPNAYRLRVFGVGGTYGLPTQEIQVIDSSDRIVAKARNRDGGVLVDGVALSFKVSHNGEYVNAMSTPFSPFMRVRENDVIAKTLLVRAIDGTIVRIGGVRRLPVLLNFFSITCRPCIDELPLLKRLNSEGRVQVVSIGNDEVSELESFVLQYGVSWPVIFEDMSDGRLGIMFDIVRYPSNVLIDAHGRIVCVGCSTERIRRLSRR